VASIDRAHHFSLLPYHLPPPPSLFPYTTLFRSLRLVLFRLLFRLLFLRYHHDLLSAVDHPSRHGLLRTRQADDPLLTLFQFTYRSEEHTSELQSRFDLVCRLLLEKKNKQARPAI